MSKNQARMSGSLLKYQQFLKNLIPAPQLAFSFGIFLLKSVDSVLKN